ncbi:MAG: NUDIX domain-containing protein [Clostridiales bacterium]|nr:NUDIX domain-containing protein [Clostridiales bacterium]
MEYLDIVDENGVPTGEQIERRIAHEQGIRHRTSHVWLFRKKNDELQVLLQKRCLQKDSFPGCYDISSAGHIPAGVDFIPSAIRELKEELGIDVLPGELVYCGQRKFTFEQQFHGKLFKDCQISNVYLLWKDLEVEEFKLQESEIEEVIWMNFEECIEKVTKNQIPHCIFLEELQILKPKIYSV